MSLAEKWEETLKELDSKWNGALPKHLEIMAQKVFYAGAEAYRKEGHHEGCASINRTAAAKSFNYIPLMLEQKNKIMDLIQAEIDRFKGQK